MKILMISDLHIDDTLDISFVDNIFEKMTLVINKSISANEEIYAFILGDIINKGNENAERKYQIAEQVFIKLRKKINTDNLKFFFIPGNHDVCGKQLTYFDLFLKKFSYVTIEFEKTSFFQEKIDGLNFIFADSVTHRERNNGKLNVGEIEKLHPDILCLHHSIEAQNDWSGFTYDATDILKINSQFIFHGHTHGACYWQSGCTKIISVGSLLLDYCKSAYANVNNQFNFIEIKNGSVVSVNNFKYFGDVESFEPYILYSLEVNQMFSASLVEIPLNDDKYIKRSIVLCSGNDNDEFEHITCGSRKTVLEALNDDDLILLVGEAGIGKSYELKKLYNDNINSNIFYPLHFSIRDCSLNEIVDKINFYGKYTNNKKVLYIFDGLDEIQPKERNEFIKIIRTHFTKLSGKSIIISTRENFALDISDFRRYRMLKMTNKDIVNYIKDYGIFDNDFNKLVAELNCQSEMKIPFYLTGLIKLLQSKNLAPTKVDIMENLISSRVSNDINKYDTTIDLKTVKYKLVLALQEIAFSMQLIKKYSLEDETYQSMFHLEIRNLINYFGAFSYHTDKNAWEFEHNNFREYLAAKYLNQFSFDEIISIIVYDENCSKLRPSWLNVVAYLLPMQNDDKLINWLIVNAKDALCNFESDKVTLNNRNQIFVAVMNDVLNKQLPIFSIYDVNKLGRYFQSEDTISFMLELLKNRTNNYAISSVLHVLRCCDNFYGKENELKTVIFEKHLKNMKHEHIVELSVEVLARIFTTDLCKIVQEIFTVLCKDERSRVFGSLCELLVEAKVVDNYIDDIIKASRSDGILEDFPAQRGFENILTNVKSIKGINSVMELFCNNELPYVIDRKDGILAHNCERAAALFLQGDAELLTMMVDCFIAMASKCDSRKCNLIKSFFLTTQTLPEAFEIILNRKLRADSMMFTIEDIMDESLEDILIEKYLNSNVVDEAFKWYANRLPHNSALFMKIDDAVFKKEGLRIQREPQFDWNRNRKECNQKYFNCLFDKNLFSQLLDELLSYIKNDNITCEQLVSISSDEIYDFSAVPHDRQDLQNIRTALYHSGLTAHKVIQFFDYINWEIFCTCEMCRLLEQNRTDIEIDESQKRYIDDYLKNQMQIINFENYSENVIEMNDTKYIFAHGLIRFATQVNFNFSDEKLLEMLVLPWYMFVSLTSTGESGTLKFITSRITDSMKLQEKILENIREKKLAPLAAQTHLLYCLENKLLDAVDLAVNLFYSDLEEAKHHKNTAVDYLLAVKGNKFVDSLVLQITDQDLLRYLAHCLKTDNINLINKMVVENKKSESQVLFLKELIELNNRYALKTYLNLAKRANALPDHHADNSRIGEITMSIRTINDISLIDIISALFEVCYAEGFADEESFGLKGALDAVINKFTQTDEISTKEMLTNITRNHPRNAKLISICNWHLNNIEKLITVSNDLPWELEETIVFLQSHRA